MKWINCNEKSPTVDAVVRKIGYTDTMDSYEFKEQLKIGMIKAIDYQYLDESPTLPADIEAAAEAYANDKYGKHEDSDRPVVWNKWYSAKEAFIAGASLRSVDGGDQELTDEGYDMLKELVCRLYEMDTQKASINMKISYVQSRYHITRKPS